MKSDEVFALENAGWPALLVNDACTILRANQAARKLFGQALEGAAPLLGAIWASENGTAPEHFIAHWERSPVPNAPLKLRIKGGTIASFPISICSFQKDGQRYFLFQLPTETGVHDSKGPADPALPQKHKLDVAMQLARTVSLDFNNALTSILGYTSLILTQMEPNNPWRHLLVEVEKSASKAAEIANDLGTFSRQEKESRSQASGNLNSLVQRATDLIRNSTTKQISWSVQLERKLFTAKFDEAKLQQAVVKVLENATEAIESGGRITVQTRNVELSQGTQDRDLRLAPGTYICVELSDTGSGIAADILPRIFEPFFTTKKASGHRGLGLALVYGIVTNHGGGVAVSSQPGVGTSVRIYLPAEKRIIQDSGAAHQDLNGTETILMVDDEDLLLTMGKTILSAYGYKVLTANSGQKALDVFSRKDPPIDLVITDMVMPAMSGRELAEHIRRQSPDTPILCTSGFVRPSNQADDVSYLQKPFTSAELLTKVKLVLAGNIS